MPWSELIVSLVEIVEERTCSRHLIATPSEAGYDAAVALPGPTKLVEPVPLICLRLPGHRV